MFLRQVLHTWGDSFLLISVLWQVSEQILGLVLRRSPVQTVIRNQDQLLESSGSVRVLVVSCCTTNFNVSSISEFKVDTSLIVTHVRCWISAPVRRSDRRHDEAEVSHAGFKLRPSHNYPEQILKNQNCESRLILCQCKFLLTDFHMKQDVERFCRKTAAKHSVRSRNLNAVKDN